MTNARSESSSQWWRDAVHVARRLRGSLPAPVTLTTPRAIAGASRALMEPGKKSQIVCTIAAIARPTADSVSLTIALPGAPLMIEAGQFITVSIAIEGQVHRRNYSISCAGGALSQLQITVKRTPGGVVSSALVLRAKVGDAITIEGPHGQFVRRAEDRGPLVLVAAGSGITPVFSILQTALARDPDLRALLVFGNRTWEDVIFRDEIAALTAQHRGLKVVHVLEGHEHAGAATVDAEVGRLEHALFHRIFSSDSLARDPAATFFVCGPSAVRANAQRAFSDLGIASTRVRTERYTHDVDAASRASPAQPARVLMHGPNGTRVHVTLAPNETLLAGAIRAGQNPPFSCTMGGCGECKMKLLAGAVTMEEPNCLLPHERAEGYVLACVARAEDGCVVRLGMEAVR